MLSEQEKSLMRQCLMALRGGMHGFATRHAQLAMMAEVAHALSSLHCVDNGTRVASVAVIEAGTGTGKTLGYLLPAIVLAHLRGLKLVVSSSTVALQEQLMNKDVPALQAHMPFRFNCALVKGRKRYVCPAKLLGMSSQLPVRPQNDQEEAEINAPCMSPGAGLESSLVDAFVNHSWSGDRDDWPQPIPEKQWQRLSTDGDGCMGNACPEYGQCPFYAARQQLKEAEVMIVNHDLLLSVMEMEGGSFLSDPGQTLFVLDEAHALPTKAASRLASRHAVEGARRWIDDFMGLAEELGDRLRLEHDLVRSGLAGACQLAAVLATLHETLTILPWMEAEDEAIQRFSQGIVPQAIADLGIQIQESATGLKDALERMRDTLMDRAREGGVIVQPYVAAIGTYLGHIDKLIATWERMLQLPLPDQKPMARWLERSKRQGREHGKGVEFHVCAAPICGGARLEELLWRKAGAVVLTSATLQACGSFDLFLEESGLDAHEDVKLVSLPSPFDYQQQAQLRIPTIRSHPRKSEEHSMEVAALMPKLVEGHLGVLALFSSARQMSRVAALLPDVLRSVVLMQGSMSKRELLNCHKARIDAGQPSILFGLASLSEGVDLPGNYCTHVIVAKLPFAVPGDPIEEARREWIEAQGRSAFHERSVPEVGIRLAQSVGRLLRTQEDWGVVTILDPRLGNTAWGRRLLRGLPPFRVVRETLPDRMRA